MLNTEKNPKLKIDENKYKPAYELENGIFERDGRK